MPRGVFLDRDGVINKLIYYEEHGVLDSPFVPEQMNIFPWVGEAIRKLAGGGYKVFIASNQPGLAKGQISRENFEKIREKMNVQLANEKASVDGEYYCFHHPDGVVSALTANCACRKPKPGLLLQAAAQHNIDLTRSWMIGDNLTDVKAGKSAGCQTILLGGMKCQLCRMMDEQAARPDAIANNLLDAVSIILNSEAKHGNLC